MPVPVAAAQSDDEEEEDEENDSYSDDGSPWSAADEALYSGAFERAQPPAATALGLPTDLWRQILDHLAPADCARMRRVSRHFRDLVTIPDEALSGLEARDWAAMLASADRMPALVWRAKAASMLTEIYESDEAEEGLARLAGELREADCPAARSKLPAAYVASIFGRCKPWYAFACLHSLDAGLPSSPPFLAWLEATYLDLLVRRHVDVKPGPRMEVSVDPRLWFGASFVDKSRRSRAALTDPLWWDWAACPEPIVRQSVLALEQCRREYLAASPPLNVWVVIRSRCESTPPEDFVRPLVTALKSLGLPVLVE